MFIKKYEAESLDKALSLIKGELGANALILSTHEKKRKWFQKRIIEVTAAKNEKKDVTSVFDDEYLKTIFPHRREVDNNKSNDGVGFDVNQKRKLNKYLELDEPLITPTSFDSSTHTQYIQELKNRGLSEESAKEITTRLIFDYPREERREVTKLESLKSKIIASQIQTISPVVFESRPNWAFIGIGGVGKTSLIVKLALLLKRLSYKVQFIGCDTRKIVGRRELFTYARIINVDCFNKPSFQLRTGVIQLIDTPAYSLDLKESNKSIEKILSYSNIVLVIDASNRLEEAMNIVEQTMKLRPSAIAFTKLDVATRYGLIYDVIKKTKLPLFGISVSASFKIPFRFLSSEDVGLMIVKGVIQ